MPRRALVLGGSGAVGAEVVRALAAADVSTTFTYHQGREKAEALAAELSLSALPLDLRDPQALRALVAGLEDAPDILIHCAAVTRSAPLSEVSDDDWREAVAINAHSALVACQALAPRLTEGGDVILLGALDRAQSLPIPLTFAATQGMLGALTMSLAKELGPRGIRVNMLALGVLEGGLSRDLSGKVLADFEAFSALARRGTPREVAESVVWLALENSYLSGKVIPLNGGI